MELSDRGVGAMRIRQGLDPSPPEPKWLVEFKAARRSLAPEIREVLQAFGSSANPRSTMGAYQAWKRKTGEGRMTFFRRLALLRKAFRRAKELHDSTSRARN